MSATANSGGAMVAVSAEAFGQVLVRVDDQVRRASNRAQSANSLAVIDGCAGDSRAGSD
ncbi:hypothetical protein [Kitasatospora purpeofusca]|uniref:hypothetical protein n=1 Tax=Kitasatospora purpeofusca TaxID=67352 RepID=UPI002A59BA5C|nr:hypothetical protein [Kitasatospora purpeofusca]MDY0813006.1 hypothetical protein [Kitasatospora purpeofusca]